MSPANAFLDLNRDVSLSAGHDRMIVFARRASGVLAHIDEVANGKACDCVCLACGEALIARQGEVLAHSFAHPSGTQCDEALQAMLHGVVVALIERDRRFVTPASWVEVSLAGPHGQLTEVRQRAASMVPVESVALALRAPWSRPCIVVVVKERELLVHIAVHRRSAEHTRKRLAALDQAAVEIDLTQRFPRTVAELASILLTADSRKAWLFNHRDATLREQLEVELRARADELRRENAERVKARQEQAEREHDERTRARSVALAAQEELLARRLAEAAQCESASVTPRARTRPSRPAELSPNIEYRSSEGRLWLLHSSQPGICFRIEPAARHALLVLEHFGATEDVAGVYRISTEGWANASIELSSAWLAVRSVTGAIDARLDDVGQ